MATPVSSAAGTLPLPAPPGMCLDARGGLVLTRSATLLVGDLHLGYANALQRRGVLLACSNRDGECVQRVIAMVQHHAVRRVVLLGDLKHEPGPPRDAEKAAIGELFGAINSAGAQVHVVLGNHDRGLGEWLASQGVTPHLQFADEAGDVLAVHGDDPAAWQSHAGPVVVGHLHPAVGLNDGRGAHMRMPVFLVSPKFVLLPAMSAHSMGMNVLKAGASDHALLARDDYRVIAIDTLGGRKPPVLRPLRPLRELRG